MIIVDKITKTYNTKSGEYGALNDVNLTIHKGSFCSIAGRSGSGKSSLLHIIGALDSPNSGGVIINGKELNKMNKIELAAYRNKELGFVFQAYHLENSYNVYHNVEIPLIIGNVNKGNRKNRIMEVLSAVGIEQLSKKYPYELSGGEKQRVSIARALVNHPKIILADEPCGNLDSENGNIIMKLFRSLSDQNVTILLVTHNEEDAQMTDRIIKLKDGRVISDETI